MATERQRHWDAAYQVDPSTKKWHQDFPAQSLAMLRMAGAGPTAGVVDVGGGASRFAEHLLDLGYDDVTVLDVSPLGMSHAQRHLGERADRVQWLVADVTRYRFTRTFDVWHDRAVFHFLADEADRQRYLDRMRAAVAPGGYTIVATFGPEAPEYCSGLPVARYGPDDLVKAIGGGFDAKEVTEELHVTPGGDTQPFTWALLRRT